MKKLIILITILSINVVFSQPDSKEIKADYLNHTTSPVTLTNVSTEWYTNKLIIELEGISKIESIIKDLTLKIFFYNHKDELVRIKKLTLYEHIYPGEKFEFKSEIEPGINQSEIHKILFFPSKASFSINLQWSMAGIIEEQQEKYAALIPIEQPEQEKVAIEIPDSADVPLEADSLKFAVIDSIKIDEDSLNITTPDTLKITPIIPEFLGPKEITATNINDIQPDSSTVIENIVTEVFDDEVLVSLGSDYISRKKKYLILWKIGNSQEEIAIAEPVEIFEDKSRLKMIYYYGKRHPEVGDLFFEYVELREKFNLFNFVLKHKKEGFLSLAGATAVLSYLYHQKSSDTFKKYKSTSNQENAAKFREDTKHFEKVRNAYIYSTAVFSAAALISYLYDKFIKKENNKENKYPITEKSIKPFMFQDIKSLFGLKVSF